MVYLMVIKDKVLKYINIYFDDMAKSELWYTTPNPNLGNVTPEAMVYLGCHKKLINIIKNMLEEGNLI